MTFIPTNIGSGPVVADLDSLVASSGVGTSGLAVGQPPTAGPLIGAVIASESITDSNSTSSFIFEVLPEGVGMYQLSYDFFSLQSGGFWGSGTCQLVIYWTTFESIIQTQQFSISLASQTEQNGVTAFYCKPGAISFTATMSTENSGTYGVVLRLAFLG